MFEKIPELHGQRHPIFPGKLIEFAGFFLLRIFRHPYSPILSELVEITVETFGPTVCNPVTFGVAVKLAA